MIGVVYFGGRLKADQELLVNLGELAGARLMVWSLKIHSSPRRYVSQSSRRWRIGRSIWEEADVWDRIDHPHGRYRFRRRQLYRGTIEHQ